MSDRKRDLFVALTVGSVIPIGLNIWFNAVAKPETIDSYLWLSRLQEPGAYVGERVAWSLYPRIGYPWNVRVAVPCGYAVLVLMWTVLTAALLYLGRFAASAVNSVPKALKG